MRRIREVLRLRHHGLTERVAKLETEIAALRRMLKQLRNELAAAGEVEAA